MCSIIYSNQVPSRGRRIWQQDMTFPFSVRSTQQDAFLFTIPSSRVMTKIRDDYLSSPRLRTRATARVLENNVRRVENLLSYMHAEVTAVIDRNERLVRLFLLSSPLKGSPLESDNVLKPTHSRASTQAVNPRYVPSLSTILEETEEPCSRTSKDIQVRCRL